jgi:hypothetical protein
MFTSAYRRSGTAPDLATRLLSSGPDVLTANRGRVAPRVEVCSMDTASQKVTLTPKAEVFAEARRRGLEPSDDRFDRFRTARLIGDLATIEGTTQHGFTPTQAQRFFDLLTLCKKLDSKRPRASALAFWLCWDGATDVPPELICEHIERTVQSFLRYLRRQYDRRRVPYRSAGDPERWRKAGMPWVKPFIKELLTSFIGNGLMLDILSTVVGLFLRALFSNAAFEAAAPILKRLAFLFGIKQVKPEAMRGFWNVAQEGTQLFTTDERTNALITAVREVNAQAPGEIIGLVHDTRRTIAAMSAAFPTYDVTTAPAVPDPRSDVSVTLNRLFPPGMTAVTALTRKEPHAIEMRENLRSGNVEPVVEEFRQVRVIRDTIFAHIRKEQP